LGKGYGIFKPIIVVRLYGGLGNQLFTYAAAKRLSVFNHCKLYIDAGSGFIRDHKYKRSYRLDAFEITSPTATWGPFFGFIITYSRKIIESFNKKLSIPNKIIVRQKKVSFDADLLTLQITKSVVFEGFWQSEGYFKDIESIIRSEFRFKQSIVSEILPFTRQIDFTKAVAIHVRHFKDEHHINQGNVNDEYYIRSIVFFQNHIPDAEFWLFSDDPERALLKFKDVKIKCIPISSILKDSNEVKELFIMSQFRNFIISNSTFSWWGAWLSDFSDKKVVAPAEIIDSGEGCWGFEGLLPREWITL
jgi:hypothetical protein